MSEPFVGEIRLFGNNYAPRGWMKCEGQILQINTNQALYSLLGTTYGGNGQTTFALPDLRGRVAIHNGNGVAYGTSAGEAAHTLTVNEMPQHNHTVSSSSNAADQISPAGNVWAATAINSYSPAASLVPMSAGAVSTSGGSEPHNNMQPYLAVNYCIAIEGIFPSRN